MRPRFPLALFLAALLPACTIAAGSGGPAAGVATEAIEVTPLNGAAPPAAAEAAAAPGPESGPEPAPETERETAAAAAAAGSPADPAPADPGASQDGAAPAAPQDGPADGGSSEGEADAATAEPPPAPALSPAAQACIRRGGKWVGTGSSGLMACVKTTRDAGESCRKQADCQGYCLARSRTCAPYTPLFGCNEVLGPNGERTTICLD